MARVNYGSTVTALRGSIGGHTFQRNNSGNVVRLRPFRKSVNSQKQIASTILFAQISRRWANLTLSQRNAWNSFAVLHTKFDPWGDEKIITGFNYFVSVNINAFYLSVADFDDPPSFVSVAPVPSFNVQLDSTNFSVVFDPDYDSGNYCIAAFASQPIKQLSQLNRKSLRFISIFDPGVFSNLNLIPDWESYFSISLPNPYIPKSFFLFVAIQVIDPASCLSSIYTTQIGPSI